ncbi:MAG: PD-(D/E)XK nuclease family protein, partial [Caulobacterales bacterium]|nr:PD-(D/E)XK nuclease family protein [Caulobacterales bacterium]
AELEARGLTAAELAREEARMRRAAAWFDDWERSRRAAGWRPAALETGGAWALPGVTPPFTLTSKADRIDEGPGGWAVLDYKTGQPPTAREAAAGLEPQLPVEALILAHGGFRALDRGDIAQLVYVRVRGGRVPGEERDLAAGREGRAPADLMDAALEGLVRRALLFDRPQTPYPSQIAPRSTRDAGDYDRLARRKEWSGPAEDGEG